MGVPISIDTPTTENASPILSLPSGRVSRVGVCRAVRKGTRMGDTVQYWTAMESKGKKNKNAPEFAVVRAEHAEQRRDQGDI